MCPPDESTLACPTEDDLVALVCGLVSDPALVRTLEAHLDACATCHALTEQARRARTDSHPSVVVTHPASAAEGGDLAPGARLGRYAILERIGQGGMGTVYAAYDPELDRRLALKMVRARRGEGAAELEDRLRSEAKAMARLVHPNVIAVHDVGVSDAGVFLAMDYVDGTTLRRWLAERPREPEEIVAVFVEAGRGLAAAHRAGIVHRDFKPDNVLIGRDGHARVGDFGLAATTEAEASPGLAGTPAYMAPEQLDGREIDARADVFAFGVALWEALAGRQPFPVSGSAERLRAIERGELAPAPRGRMPPRVARSLARALAFDRAARWSTMEALLARLAPARSRVAPLAAGVVALGLATAVAYQRGAAREEVTCRGGEARVAAAWGPREKEAVRSAMLTSTTPVTLDAWQSVERQLDGYAHDWSTSHRAACEATRKTGEQSEVLLNRRMRCLDQRLEEMSSLVAILSRPDPGLVANAARGAQSLSRLAACADAEALLAPVALPQDAGTRSAVDRLETGLARNRAVGLAGNYKEQLAQLEGLVAEAQRLSYPPTLGRALFLQGQAFDQVADFKRAAEVMLEASYAADAGGDRKLAARARAELVWIVGHDVGEHARGLEYGREAEARVRGLGGDAEIEGQIASHLRAVLGDLGRMQEGLEQDRKALRLREAALGSDAIPTTMSRVNLGVDYDRSGRKDEALALFERALESYRQKLGEHHRLYAHTLFNIASTESDLGRIDAAKRHAERSRDLLVEVLGPEHNLVASAENVLGLIAWREERFADAAASFERAVRISEKVRGPDHVFTAHYVLARASALRALGRLDEALALASRALGVYEKTGSAAAVGRARTELSEVAEARGHHDDALREAERAVAVLDRQPPEDPDGLVSARFALAKRLAVRPESKARGHAIVASLLAGLPQESADRKEIAAWLVAHP